MTRASGVRGLRKGWAPVGSGSFLQPERCPLIVRVTVKDQLPGTTLSECGDGAFTASTEVAVAVTTGPSGS